MRGVRKAELRYNRQAGSKAAVKVTETKPQRWQEEQSRIKGELKVKVGGCTQQNWNTNNGNQQIKVQQVRKNGV